MRLIPPKQTKHFILILSFIDEVVLMGFYCGDEIQLNPLSFVDRHNKLPFIICLDFGK